MSEMNETSRTDGDACAVCRVAATQKCSGCRNVFYCSREHQKKHWKLHSKRCKTVQVEETPKLGRHFTAIRNIDVGEIVLREDKPLVSGPPQDTPPVCLGCYVVLTSSTAVPCKKCGWPLCESCKSHGPECEFTSKHKETKVSITDYGYPHPTYRCITVIRVLSLRESDPEVYKRFSNLEDHCEKASEITQGINDVLEVARFVKRFFNLKDIDEKEIGKIAGVLQVNGHEVPITEPSYVSVYDRTSFLEHNCRANCSKSFTGKGGIIIRAALPIAKGDHISICYTDPLWGASNRRHHLLQTKYFECACERCKDPTEFKTMYNAVRCTRTGGCPGYMLPPTFVISQENLPPYTCNKCSATMPFDEVEDFQQKVGVDVAGMQKDDVEACKDFLNRYADRLHGNHYYMTDVKLALAQIIGQKESPFLQAVDDELLKEKIVLCKKLDELLRVLVPAENRVRGLILFELHAALSEHGRRLGPEALQGTLIDSRKVLAESYELLRYEPEILPEGMVAVHAYRNLRSLDAIIEKMCQNSISPL